MKNNWQTKKLGEICKTSSGGTPSRKNKKFYDGEIHWVKSGELNFNTIRDTEEKISDEAIKESSAKLFPKGTLLIALYGATVGKLAFLGLDAATNQAVCAIMPENGLENKYLYWYLFSKRKDLVGKSIGGAQPNISQTILKDVDVPVPPLPTQNRIVEKIEELFSYLDNGIENLKKAKQQLKTYKQSVLKAAFEGKLTKQWRDQQEDLPTPEELKIQSEGDYEIYREKELSLWRKEVKKWEEKGEPGKKPWKPRKRKELDPISNEEIKKAIDIPDNWVHLRLQKLGKEIFDGPFGSKLKTKDYTDEGVRVIRLENLDWLNFKNEHKTYVSKDKYEEIKKHTVYYRDIIFASFISDSTRVTVLPKVIDKAVNKADCFCVRTFDSVNPYYLCFYLATNHAYNQLSHKVHGATRPRVNTTQLKETVTPVCSKEEQDKIVNEIESRFSILDQLDETIEEELKKSKALRQSILKKAFEGRLIK